MKYIFASLFFLLPMPISPHTDPYTKSPTDSIDINIVIPRTTSLQLFRFVSACAGLLLLVYSLIHTKQDKKERRMQAAVGSSLLLGAFYYESANQQHTTALGRL